MKFQVDSQSLSSTYSNLNRVIQPQNQTAKYVTPKVGSIPSFKRVFFLSRSLALQLGRSKQHIQLCESILFFLPSRNWNFSSAFQRREALRFTVVFHFFILTCTQSLFRHLNYSWSPRYIIGQNNGKSVFFVLWCCVFFFFISFSSPPLKFVFSFRECEAQLSWRLAAAPTEEKEIFLFFRITFFQAISFLFS